MLFLGKLAAHEALEGFREERVGEVAGAYFGYVARHVIFDRGEGHASKEVCGMSVVGRISGAWKSVPKRVVVASAASRKDSVSMPPSGATVTSEKDFLWVSNHVLPGGIA